jgi:hypothetical protein
MISLHSRCRSVPFVVGAAFWVYINKRAAIARSMAVVGEWFGAAVQPCVTCWRRLKRRIARRRPSAESAVVRSNDDALL